MNNLYWEKIGSGDIDLIFLHGWGLNIKIWYHIISKLDSHFTLYLVDLPGFGKSKNCAAINIKSTIEILSYYMPKNAIWLGWSLGGLIANMIGLYYPKSTRAIINVASSPCFTIRPQWPGINPKILKDIYNSLSKNYAKTIENFIDLQIFNFSLPDQYFSTLKKKYYYTLFLKKKL